VFCCLFARGGVINRAESDKPKKGRQISNSGEGGGRKGGEKDSHKKKTFGGGGTISGDVYFTGGGEKSCWLEKRVRQQPQKKGDGIHEEEGKRLRPRLKSIKRITTRGGKT